MPMIDPFSLKRPPAEEETRTFEENGTTLTLTLRKRNDFSRKMLAADRYALYARRYVTGEEMTGDDGVKRREVSTLPAADGIIPAMSERLCDLIASLETMQVPDPGEEPLTFQQWAAFGVVLPETMDRVYDWMLSLMQDAPEDAAKNTSGEAAAP